jgi:hypothetical protein
MEPVSTQVSSPARSVTRRACLILTSLMLVGCTHGQKLVGLKKTEPYDPNQPAQMGMAWNNKVVYAADPTRGGVIMPVLTGRMYLFAAKESHSLVCPGTLTVDLWDHTPQSGKNEPQMLEQWVIDPETLAKLLKEDIIGQGYSIGLPWSTYRPDISSVHMIVRFDPSNGKPHVLQQGGFTVDHTATKELQSGSSVAK